ncbi:MAG: hypothetical protein HY564_01070 [Candidatus Jacksonbacteria bacterium]|nr:hypothetical protein [Candidatus Jacksonbacteria bacterium]
MGKENPETKNLIKSDEKDRGDVDYETANFGPHWPFDVPDSAFSQTGRINSPVAAAPREKRTPAKELTPEK